MRRRSPEWRFAPPGCCSRGHHRRALWLYDARYPPWLWGGLWGSWVPAGVCDGAGGLAAFRTWHPTRLRSASSQLVSTGALC